MYDLAALLASIRRRRFLAAALFVLLAFIGAAAVLITPRTYETSSEVLVKRPDTSLQSTNYPQIEALLAWNPTTAMETYVAMARRPAIAARVVAVLGLKTTSKDLVSHVVVTPLTNSDIINIAAAWRNPEGSAALANAFARVFVEQQRALAASQASEAAASLTGALRKAQADLSSAERDLTLFESRHELTDASTQTSSILAAISDVQTKERAVEAERVQAQGQLGSIGPQLAALPGTIAANRVVSGSPSVDQIQQQLSQQEVNLRILRRQFTEQYPDVVAARNQIASLQGALKGAQRTKVASTSIEPNPLGATLQSQAATLEGQIAGDTSQLNALRGQEASLLEELRLFPAGVSELSDLQRREKAAEDIYNALQTNYFNAVVAQSMAVSDLSVIQEADPALATVRPPRLLSLVAVLVIAFLITLAIVALLEWQPLGSMPLREVP